MQEVIKQAGDALASFVAWAETPVGAAILSAAVGALIVLVKTTETKEDDRFLVKTGRVLQRLPLLAFLGDMLVNGFGSEPVPERSAPAPIVAAAALCLALVTACGGPVSTARHALAGTSVAAVESKAALDFRSDTVTRQIESGQIDQSSAADAISRLSIAYDVLSESGPVLLRIELAIDAAERRGDTSVLQAVMPCSVDIVRGLVASIEGAGANVPEQLSAMLRLVDLFAGPCIQEALPDLPGDQEGVQ